MRPFPPRTRRAPSRQNAPRSAPQTPQAPHAPDARHNPPRSGTADDSPGLRLAVAAIRRAGPRDPADAELRSALRKQRNLPPGEAGFATEALFAYYRWRGWLEVAEPSPQSLRRALRLAREFRQSPAAFPAAELRARAVPPWVLDQFNVTESWLRAIQTEPVLWLRTRLSAAAHVGETLGLGATPWSPRVGENTVLPTAVAGGLQQTAWRYEGGEDLFHQPLFHEGAFEIQDLASQVVGWICQPQPGETWWDACAGEGGKLLHLSDLMQGRGLLWASDRATWRLDRLRRRAARARCFNYRAVVWDGGPKPPTRTRFDGILVDAPCSGVGTWQRNPHARWTTGPEDVAELATAQSALLDHVAPSLKPGGRLIYSVCTLTRAETEAVATRFTASHPDFQPLDLAPPSSGSPGSLTIRPESLDCNGMFVAAWRRAE